MKLENHKQQTQTGASNHKIKNTHKNKQTNKIKKIQTKKYNHKKLKQKNTGSAKRDEERTNKVKKKKN